MKSMKELLETAKSSMEKREDFVFVTVVASSGSVPRGAGSKMLVLADGTSYGTVGGGNVEHTSILLAQEALLKKQSFSRAYRLQPGQAADLGMICGGDVRLYFQYISWKNRDFYKLSCRLLNTWDTTKGCWLVLDLTDENGWTAGAYIQEEGFLGISAETPSALLQPKAVCITLQERSYYSEPLVGNSTVYIFGGGHVAQELVPLLAHLDFRCVVFDDREAFSSRQRFPAAARCITGDFTRLEDYLDISSRDYACIMTRGHQYDYLLQKQLLRTDAAYIGVMGSRRKKETIRQKLLADGFADEEIQRIVTPIGLEIQAETPAEIAVSIAAQLIAHRAGSL